MRKEPWFDAEEKKTDDVLKYLEPNPRLTGLANEMSHHFAWMARTVIDTVVRCPQRTIALNNLLAAKDAAVRASLDL